MTEERPHGFRSAGGKIARLGGPPLGVRRIDATVTLKLTGPGEPTAVALDANGYAAAGADRATIGRAGAAVTVRLADDAIYHVVHR